MFKKFVVLLVAMVMLFGNIGSMNSFALSAQNSGNTYTFMTITGKYVYADTLAKKDISIKETALKPLDNAEFFYPEDAINLLGKTDKQVIAALKKTTTVKYLTLNVKKHNVYAIYAVDASSDMPVYEFLFDYKTKKVAGMKYIQWYSDSISDNEKEYALNSFYNVIDYTGGDSTKVEAWQYLGNDETTVVAENESLTYYHDDAIVMANFTHYYSEDGLYDDGAIGEFLIFADEDNYGTLFEKLPSAN